jgi:hypothetical protein
VYFTFDFELRGLPMATNVELSREYISAIERGATGQAFAKFFTLT